MLIIFFSVLFLIKFLVIFLVLALKGPIIGYIFTGISAFVKHVIDGFILNHDLPDDEKFYDSHLIHWLRYALLIFVLIYSIFLLFCFGFLLKVLFYDDNI